MRAICLASAVLLGAGALTSCVPAADAAIQTDFNFSVLPSTVRAGGEVTLHVTRNRACRGEAAVDSPAFDPVTIPRGETWTTVVVDRDAEPGALYDVEFECDGSRGFARLTIARGRPAHHPDRHPAHHPRKGVHAGEGGTLAGFDLKEIGLGAALIAGSLGVAYHFARRRTDGDAG
ncbi:hypothetical protein ADK65_19000 [Streptomyces sp. NRRL B-1140]|uniref:hypothetical protein n=1 Tax=Streptomyces sp. NRRL B-1140 TaxID=1415549 RepID=UPI0006AE7E11|nr:hypothetical protein [Streptomyces sp. NRRL B-1140]KOV99048.1 hypothetical protein ADK65_19000 [Streptomyces sp. NRRL B-1140]